MTACEAAPERRRADAYGEAFADVYDSWYAEVTDAEATARFVAARSRGRTVLELGVGTGRLAEPLAEAGLPVIGLDASATMLARCVGRGLPATVQLVRGDMSVLPLAGRFGVVLVAFNTLFNLPSAMTQRRLFHELRPLVAHDGAVVIEALDARVLDRGRGRSIGISNVGGGASGDPAATGRGALNRVTVVATDVDPEAQTIDGLHVDISDQGVRVRPWLLRWASTDELDGFAAEAGFELSERYSGWDGAAHHDQSDSHISVYRPACDDPGN